jgi:glutathione S-transferase
MYTLYVIPGSHACRSAILMLEHKRLSHRRIDIPTLLHPLVARLYGFDAGGQTRTAGRHRPSGLRLGDRLGTVPALAADGERISTNHRIARFLDDRHPEPALLPPQPDRRRAVEEVERWANETLQMAARRIALGATLREDWPERSRGLGDGRMGHLLYRSTWARRRLIPLIRLPFAVDPAAERELLATLPALLDRVDAWIAEGLIGGAQPNVADLMVAPSLALMLYRPELRGFFEGRPALDLADRLLAEPSRA